MRGTILVHSTRRFACKSSFSETTADEKPLKLDDTEVTREIAR